MLGVICLQHQAVGARHKSHDRGRMVLLYKHSPAARCQPASNPDSQTHLVLTQKLKDRLWRSEHTQPFTCVHGSKVLEGQHPFQVGQVAAMHPDAMMWLSQSTARVQMRQALHTELGWTGWVQCTWRCYSFTSLQVLTDSLWPCSRGRIPTQVSVLWHTAFRQISAKFYSPVSRLTFSLSSLIFSVHCRTQFLSSSSFISFFTLYILKATIKNCVF